MYSIFSLFCSSQLQIFSNVCWRTNWKWGLKKFLIQQRLLNQRVLWCICDDLNSQSHSQNSFTPLFFLNTNISVRTNDSRYRKPKINLIHDIRSNLRSWNADRIHGCTSWYNIAYFVSLYFTFYSYNTTTKEANL